MTVPPGAFARLPVISALVLSPLVFCMASENTALVKSLLLGLCAAVMAAGFRPGNPVFTARFAPLNALILLAAAHAAASPSKSFALSSLIPLATLWVLAMGGARFPSARLRWAIPLALLGPAVIGALEIAGLDPSPWQQIADEHFHGRICSTLGNPNFFAAFIAAALPFCVWGFAVSARPAAKAAFGALFSLGLLDLLFTGSKGGILGAAAAGLVFAIASRRIRSPGKAPAVRWRRIGAGAAVVAVAGFLFLPPEIKSRLLFAAPEDPVAPGTGAMMTNESIRFRQLTWVQVMRMSKAAPILGHGLGRFQVVYPKFRRPEIIRMFGQHSYMTDHPENISLEILAELGILGLGLWAWLLAVLARLAWHKLGRSGWFAAAAAASLAALLTTNSVGVDAHYGVTAPMAALIGAMLIAKSAAERGEAPARPAGIARYAAVSAGALLFLAWVRIAGSDMHLARAIAHSQRADWDAAIRGYRSARLLNPLNVMSRYFEASALLDRGRGEDLGEAEWLFGSVRGESPDYVLLNYKLYLMYNRQGRRSEAEAALDRQIELDPLAAVFYLDRGRAAVSDERLEDARKDFEIAVRVEPDNPSGYQFLGNLLVLEKRYREAMEIYGQGLMKNPGSVELHYNAAVAAFRMGRREQARSHALAVLEREPDHAQARLILGKTR